MKRRASRAPKPTYTLPDAITALALAELRRLHEVNQQLLAAMKEAHACIFGDHWGNALDVLAYEINKAERTTT